MQLDEAVIGCLTDVAVQRAYRAGLPASAPPVSTTDIVARATLLMTGLARFSLQAAAAAASASDAKKWRHSEPYPFCNATPERTLLGEEHLALVRLCACVWWRVCLQMKVISVARPFEAGCSRRYLSLALTLTGASHSTAGAELLPALRGPELYGGVLGRRGASCRYWSSS